MSKAAQLLSFDCPNEHALHEYAKKLAPLLTYGDCVLLRGDLGAGKTTFARAFIRARAGDVTLHVPSPTFTLMQHYAFHDGLVHHYDLYRIEHPEELLEIGFEDALDERITLVEWPEKAEDEMPMGSLEIVIEDCGEDRRRLLLYGNENWRQRLETLHG